MRVLPLCWQKVFSITSLFIRAGTTPPPGVMDWRIIAQNPVTQLSRSSLVSADISRRLRCPGVLYFAKIAPSHWLNHLITSRNFNRRWSGRSMIGRTSRKIATRTLVCCRRSIVASSLRPSCPSVRRKSYISCNMSSFNTSSAKWFRIFSADSGNICWACQLPMQMQWRTIAMLEGLHPKIPNYFITGTVFYQSGAICCAVE